MAEALNRLLYRKLQHNCGNVIIANEGQAMQMRACKDVTGRPRLSIVNAGEYYRVNCPYCTDTRQRLWVSHRYGQRDAHNRLMTFMAVCYNEHCLEDDNNRWDFYERLCARTSDLSKARIKPGKVIAPEDRIVTWPGAVRRLDKLPANHKARTYLESRHFDPDKIARLYDVHYCLDSHWFLARDRLVMPVYRGGKMRGWQCRYIGELPWKSKKAEVRQGLPPKYFSTPGAHFRSQCLYNFDRARQYHTGILVEGPTDVWAFGPMSMCVFGNTVTEYQRRTFLPVFRERSLVVLLDPEEYDSKTTRALRDLLHKAMRGHYAMVQLPEGSDPGSLDRTFLREFVRDEAAAQGVKVSYRKVEA